MVLIIGKKSLITFTHEPDEAKLYNLDGSWDKLPINLPISTSLNQEKEINNDDGHDHHDESSCTSDKSDAKAKSDHQGGQANQLPAITKKIISGQLSPSERFLALCDSFKNLIILTTSDWKIKAAFKIERNCTHMVFNSQEDQLIVANRSGLVYGYSFDSTSPKETFLLGHNSIILDIKLCPQGRYLATCDRDEKIRITNYPNCYNIESYCLGHSQFVSCIVFADNDTLISGSGDGTLRVWRFRSGRQLSCQQCNQDFDQDEESCDKLAPSAIHLLSDDQRTIGVTFYNTSKIFLYRLDEATKRLIKLSSFSLEANIINSFVINGGSLLFSFTCNVDQFVTCHKLNHDTFDGTKSMEAIERDLPLVKCLRSDHKLIESFISEREPINNINWLYKHSYDNANEYMERKKEREENKMTKKMKST